MKAAQLISLKALSLSDIAQACLKAHAEKSQAIVFDVNLFGGDSPDKLQPIGRTGHITIIPVQFIELEGGLAKITGAIAKIKGDITEIPANGASPTPAVPNEAGAVISILYDLERRNGSIISISSEANGVDADWVTLREVIPSLNPEAAPPDPNVTDYTII